MVTTALTAIDTYKKLLPLPLKHAPAYDTSRLDFAVYRDSAAEAADRARKLDPTGVEQERPPDGRPAAHRAHVAPLSAGRGYRD